MGIIIAKPGKYRNMYGVEWDITNPDPGLSRIGNMKLHAVDALPVHNQIKAVLQLDSGRVNYELDPLDWAKKANGQSSILTGYDGQVMIKIPSYFRRFEVNGNKRKKMISLTHIPGFEFVPEMFVSAYECSGSGTIMNSIKGVLPRTSLNQTQYRTYSRARGSGWEMYFYLAHKSLFDLFSIEYATRYSQLAVNNNLSSDGYRIGGLGNGVTTAVSAEWQAYNNYNPFIVCGSSDVLASQSGEVSVDIPNFYNGNTRTFKVNRYRGVENTFGHIWKYLDGCLLDIYSGVDGLSKFYSTDNPANFNSNSIDAYRLIGNAARANGFVSNMIDNEIVPLANVGNSTTYYTDYFYTSIPASGHALRVLLVGGDANDGSNAGFVCSGSHYAPSGAYSGIGSRLCFMGA